jgi:hypothetical protein
VERFESAEAEMKHLLKAIDKIDKGVEWREKRIKDTGKEITELMKEREALAWRYRELNVALMGGDGGAEEDE